MTAPMHSAAGWHNYCQRCNRRYWVASKDIHLPKVRRWTDETCTEIHVCQELPGDEG